MPRGEGGGREGGIGGRGTPSTACLVDLLDPPGACYPPPHTQGGGKTPGAFQSLAIPFLCMMMWEALVRFTTRTDNSPRQSDNINPGIAFIPRLSTQSVGLRPCMPIGSPRQHQTQWSQWQRFGASVCDRRHRPQTSRSFPGPTAPPPSPRAGPASRPDWVPFATGDEASWPPGDPLYVTHHATPQ